MELLDLGPLSARGVLLLHGSPMPAESLVPLATSLSNHHRVLLPDLPGYGDTPVAPDPVRDAQEALEELLVDLGIVTVDVVGISFGAYRALRLAATGQVHVRRVVLVGGFATLAPDERKNFRDLAEKVRRPKDVSEDFLGLLLPTERRQGLLEVVERCRAWVRDAQKRPIWPAELDAIAACEDLRPMLSELRPPLLAMHGDDDRLVAPMQSTEIARASRHGVAELLPCGHLPLDELPERVIPRIRKFLTM